MLCARMTCTHVPQQADTPKVGSRNISEILPAEGGDNYSQTHFTCSTKLGPIRESLAFWPNHRAVHVYKATGHAELLQQCHHNRRKYTKFIRTKETVGTRIKLACPFKVGWDSGQ